MDVFQGRYTNVSHEKMPNMTSQQGTLHMHEDGDNQKDNNKYGGGSAEIGSLT
jgi:hypothetical protein